jgi:hypothetical protein
MKQTLLYIFSFFICIYSYGQDSTMVNTTDSLLVERLPLDTVLSVVNTVLPLDTVIKAKKPFQAYLILDYAKPLVRAVSPDLKYEFGGGILLFNTVNIGATFGQADITPSRAIANGSYSSKGAYWRGGIGLINQFKPEAKIGISIYYGNSTFEDQGQYKILTTSTGETFQDQFERKNLSANWYEIVITSESWWRLRKAIPESKLNKLFALGFDIRWRRMINYDSFSPIDVHTVPGYGTVLNESVVALNVFLKVYPY